MSANLFNKEKGLPDGSVVKSLLASRKSRFDPWIRKIPWRRNRLPTPVFLGFPCGSAKESSCNAGDLGLIPGLGRSPGEGKGYPLQCSGLENSMDCISMGLQRVGHWLSDFHFQENVSWKLLLSIHEQRWNLIFHIMCRLEEIIFASERRREIHRDHGK